MPCSLGGGIHDPPEFHNSPVHQPSLIPRRPYLALSPIISLSGSSLEGGAVLYFGIFGLFIYLKFFSPSLVYCLGGCGFFWEKLRLGLLPLSSKNDGHAPGPS